MTEYSRSATRGVIPLVFAILLLAKSATAQNAAFALRPPHNGVPTTFAGVTYAADRIVIYDLPADGPYAAIAEQPDGYLDVVAIVSGPGVVNAAGYGAILVVTSGGPGLQFDPDDIIGDVSNMGRVKNPSLQQNPNFVEPIGAVFGETDVPGTVGGNQSIGIAAIYTVPNGDAPVRHNDGLVTIPVDVSPGLTNPVSNIKEYAVSFELDNEFTGFVNSAGTLLTNSAVFPHIGATVQIRRSIQGDLNGDGIVDTADVPVFLDALADPNRVKVQFPWLRVDYVADFNLDSEIDADDIPGFEQACGCVVVPEPATAFFALLAITLALAARAKHRLAGNV